MRHFGEKKTRGEHSKHLKRCLSSHKGLSWGWKLSNEKGQSPTKLKEKNTKDNHEKLKQEKLNQIWERDYDKTLKKDNQEKGTKKGLKDTY